MPNRPPEITSITGPLEPVAVNEEVVIGVSFSDPDIGDTHIAIIDWGDGTQTTHPIPGSTFETTDTHTYVETGTFSVVVTINDSAGASDSDTFEFIIVYDPDGGFVTGGGWIDSPAGAYQPDPTLTGKAIFAFESKYKKGAIVPYGNTKFQFNAADINFSSSSYEWLVVTGNDYAKFKGSGTINGITDPNGQPYKFMVWATDGAPDTIRIKIWYEEPGGEVIVYDNGVKQPIGGGSIMVHKGKK